MLKETSIPCTCQNFRNCNFCREFYRRPTDYDWLSEKHTHSFLHPLVSCKDCKLYVDAILYDILRVYDGQMPLYLGLFVAMFTRHFVHERLRPLFRKGELEFGKEMFNSLMVYLSMNGC